MEGRVVLVLLNFFQFIILLGAFLQGPILTSAENIDWIEETNLDFDIPSEAFNASIKDHDQIVVCRVKAEAKKRDLRAIYNIFDGNSSFDGNLCTHVVYGPFFISSSYQLEDSEYLTDISEVPNVSKRYPHLKILMEIGISKNATEILKLTQLGVQLQENHFLLITHLKNIMKKYKLDGVFLDRSFHHSVNNAAAFDKYLTSKSVSTEETLGEYLADEFHKEGLLVTAEIGMYHKQIVQNAQKSWQNYVTTLSYARVAEMSKVYDFVVVNGYKTEFRQTSISNYIAPLYSTEERHFNIHDRLKTIITDWKAYPNNLVLAVPFFGYPFLLYNSNSSSFGYLTPADPNGFAGPLLRQKAYWGYNEICYTTILNKNAWKMYWDSRAKVPFMKKGNHWISFDNWRSIKEKVLLAMSFGLKGILADSADMDDSHCAITKNPLLKSINYALKTSITDELPARICNYSDSTFNNNKAPIIHTNVFIKQVKLNTTILINCTAEGYPTPTIKLINGNNETINTINVTEYTDKGLCTMQKKQVTTLFINSESNGKYACVANNSAGEDRRDFFLMNEAQPFVVVDKEIWIRKTHMDFTLPQIKNITTIDGEQILFCKTNIQTVDVKRNYYDLTKAGDIFREKLCDVFIYGPFPVNIKYELDEKYNTQLNAVINLTRSYPDLKILLEVSVESFFTFGNHSAQYIIDFQKSIRRYGFIGVHFDSSFYMDSLRGSYLNEHSVEVLIIMQNLFHQTGLLLTMEIEITSEYVLKNINQQQLHRMIKIFNYVFVKTYDFTISTASKVTSHNAPLPSSKTQTVNIMHNLENLFEGDRSGNYSSLIFGIPISAYFYLLKEHNPFAFGFNASSMISKQKSSYGHVCFTAMQKNAINWEMYWDNVARVPFLKNKQLWFTLETPKSVYEKFLFYLTLHKKFKFKGIMVDSIDKDDFLGDCGNITYPLLRTTHSAMNAAKNSGKNNDTPSVFEDWWWVAATATASLILLSVAIICGQLIFTYINKNSDRLSKKEIEVFIWGNTHVGNNDEDIEKKPEAMPYDTSFELSQDKYEIDTQNILGAGAFGVVYKGKVDGDFVAVKSVKPGADIQFLKSLLSELKILIYLERHPNIVNLVGADTTKLKRGIVFIFVEFCPLGNLQEYLRQSRQNFRGLSDNSHTYNNWQPQDLEMDVKIKNPLSARHLIIWCHQIAMALEHLNHKKIIHGDLAARNILVFERELVKITDFGLSRKLYNYSEYVKKNQEPLPWRWMAIESLRDLTFSTQSDIWSFGITMWEIFSLAETPYPGLSWSPEFLELLKGNLRMQKPIHATNELYDFMLECWQKNPQNRPKPEDAVEFFCNLMKSTAFKRYSIHDKMPKPESVDRYSPADNSIMPSPAILI